MRVEQIAVQLRVQSRGSSPRTYDIQRTKFHGQKDQTKFQNHPKDWRVYRLWNSVAVPSVLAQSADLQIDSSKNKTFAQHVAQHVTLRLRE